jgi:hypothetical protein
MVATMAIAKVAGNPESMTSPSNATGIMARIQFEKGSLPAKMKHTSSARRRREL